jgi:ABC-type multidrug transport system fused ATPase/permease subunit
MTSKSLKLVKGDQKLVKRGRKRKVLAIISAVIFVLTFFVQEVLKERAKDVSASVESGEALYRTELGQFALSIQTLQVQQKIDSLRQDLATRPDDVGQRDYSAEIADSLRLAQQVRADLNMSVDSVSRFVDKLPSGADLRQQLNQLKPGIEKANQQVDEVLKPSPKNDWVRLVGVKLATLISAVQVIFVAMVGDAALTRARAAREYAERTYRRSVWAGYFLYTLGVGLGLYAALSGVAHT